MNNRISSTKLQFLSQIMLKFCIKFSPVIDSENGVTWKQALQNPVLHGNRVRKRRRRQEYQKLTSKMCSHNMESESSSKTIMLHIRPYMQLRCMFRSSSNFSPGVRRDQTIDFDRRSRWLSCVHTQEHMWTCDMKTTLDHWRQHLPSWMCYVLHTITCASMLQLARFPGNFCYVSYRNIWTKVDMWHMCGRSGLDLLLF